MKIDCNVTENYFKELDRMCNFFSTCTGCEIHKAIDRETCDEFQLANRKWMITTVQKWSDAHPQKTYLEDLLEKYPDLILCGDRTPEFCPSNLGLANEKVCAPLTCVECWNQPIK